MNEYSPMLEKPFNIHFTNCSIYHLLRILKIDEKSLQPLNDLEGFEGNHFSFGMNFEPKVFGKPLQRDYVWSLDDKQKLINSIYQQKFIGNIVYNRISTRTYMNMVRDVMEKETSQTIYQQELLDGKQRVLTILSFLRNEFCDENGKYFKDFSENHQHLFLSFSNIQIGEMDNLNDIQKKELFLFINSYGVQMSEEHLKYVQSL